MTTIKLMNETKTDFWKRMNDYGLRYCQKLVGKNKKYRASWKTFGEIENNIEVGNKCLNFVLLFGMDYEITICTRMKIVDGIKIDMFVCVPDEMSENVPCVELEDYSVLN